MKSFYAAPVSFRSEELKYFSRRKPYQFPTHYNPLAKLDMAKNIALGQSPTGPDYDNAVIAINALKQPFADLYTHRSQ